MTVRGCVWGAARLLTGDGTLDQAIHGLHASPYRTTKLARMMGDRRPGYQAVAVAAIRERKTC